MSTIDLHDLILPTLPEWGPDVPGTPVEVTHPDGMTELRYAWRDGWSTVTLPGRKRRTGPFPLGRARITAVLADDPTHWPAVDADERVQLGEHLVGARIATVDGGFTATADVARVSTSGRISTDEGRAHSAEFPLLVHPADLARAREAATPKPPTCWDEWEPGDVWAWGDVVYRMGDDRVLRLATIGGRWLDALLQPGGAWVTSTLTAPTEEHMARVAAADEAARLPDEPPLGSVILDRDGDEWFRTVDGWRTALSGRSREWTELHRKCGPVTVIHRAES